MSIRHARTFRRTLAVVVAIVAGACGSSSRIDPTPAPPGGTFVNIAGRWTGTIESVNLPARTVTLTVVQSGNCVDGVWQDQGGWTGAISGFATADRYEGQISLERTEAGGRCTAVGTVSGPVGERSLRWTGTGFTASSGSSCQAPLPDSVVIALQRE